MGAVTAGSSSHAAELRRCCYFVCVMGDSAASYRDSDAPADLFDFTDIAKFTQGLSSTNRMNLSSRLHEPALPPSSIPPLFAREQESRTLLAKAGLYSGSSVLFGTPAHRQELDGIRGIP